MDRKPTIFNNIEMLMVAGAIIVGMILVSALHDTMPLVSFIWIAICLLGCLVLYARGKADWIAMSEKMERYERFENRVEHDSQVLIDDLNRTIDKQVEALRSVSSLSDSDMAMLEKVQSATSQNRLELYLQPIVNLGGERTTFFEAFSRLRDETGALLRPAEYLEAVERANHIGFIDNMILMRSVQAVRSFALADNMATVFCNVSPATLYDQNFFALFTQYLDTNQDLSDQIVFEFTQPAISLLDPTIAKSLHIIAERGFSFSVDHVHRLDMDFKSLNRMNLGYIKASANILLGNGAQNNGGGASANPEFAKFYASAQEAGIELIAEKIETRAQQDQLRALGVRLGQGNYCGNPLPVKAYLENDGFGEQSIDIKRAS